MREAFIASQIIRHGERGRYCTLLSYASFSDVKLTPQMTSLQAKMEKGKQRCLVQLVTIKTQPRQKLLCRVLVWSRRRLLLGRDNKWWARKPKVLSRPQTHIPTWPCVFVTSCGSGDETTHRVTRSSMPASCIYLHHFVLT